MATMSTAEYLEFNGYEILAVGRTARGTVTKAPGTIWVIGKRGGIEYAWLQRSEVGRPHFGGRVCSTVEEAKALAPKDARMTGIVWA
jgi:hypothetical protein